MTNLNNTEHMRQLIQLVESHTANGLAEANYDAYTQDQLGKIKQQIIDYRKEGWTDREKGDATLTKEQFEEIRKSSQKLSPITDYSNGVFMEIPNFGLISLN